MKAGFQVLKRALTLLSERERKKLGLLAIAVVGMSFMELFGIVSILPFMSVATNPETIHENQYLYWAYQTFEFSSENRFLVALGMLALVALVVGNLFRAFSSFLLLRFAQMQVHHLGERVLRSYLYRPYEYFLTQNSSDLTKTVLGEVGQLINGLYVPSLRAFGRACTAVVIIGMLVFLNPEVALVMALVMGAFYFLIYKGLKKTIHNLGESRVAANQKRFRIVNEASGGIKELKLMNKEEVYLKDFSKPSKSFARTQAKNAVIGDLPKYLLEIVAFGGMLSIVIYLIATQGQGKAISMAALYAFAGYKLLPALQQIFIAVTKIRFTLPVLGLVESSLNSRPDMASKDSATDVQSVLKLNNELLLKDVSFRYFGASFDALKNINLAIQTNTTVGIIGPTGSGKTTLVDLVLGLLRSTNGKITIDGQELNSSNLSSWQADIGYVPQSIYLSDDTIEKNIAFGVPTDEVDHEQIKKAACLAQISEFIETQLPQGYQTFVGERGVRLSGGQRQRIGVARALYHEPDLLVFDEATSALDDETERSLMESIEQLSGKKTILMIAHRLSTLKKADRVIRIEKGEIVPTESSSRPAHEHNRAKS